MSSDQLGHDAQVRVFAEELREANAKLAAIRELAENHRTGPIYPRAILTILDGGDE